jgi:hypothetical protein
LFGIFGCSSSKQESKSPSQANGSLPTKVASGATPTNEASDSAQANEDEVATPNEDEVATAKEEQKRAQAQVIDHDRVLIPWWEWANPCPPDATLKGSPSTGDVRCELSQGQIHGRRTQWEPEERTRYYSKGKLLTKRLPPKKKECSTDEAYLEKLAAQPGQSSENFCIIHPPSFEGVLLEGLEREGECRTNMVVTIFDCLGYKYPPADKLLARAGWRAAPIEIRRLIAEDFVHQVLARDRYWASNKGEYVRSRIVGNKVVVGFWTLTPAATGRVNLNENEYTFKPAGTFPSFSDTSFEEISESEIRKHAPSHAPSSD